MIGDDDEDHDDARLRSRQRARIRRRREGFAAGGGFTLIEMLVVIALGAILATIVTVSLAGSYRTARIDDVVGEVATYDRLARAHAQRTGRPGRLLFDLTHATVARVDSTADDATAGSKLHLPAGVQIRRMFTPAGATSAGEVAIPYSLNGQTPTYALLLSTTEQRTPTRWLLVTGLTGMTRTVTNEREVQDIFQTLAGGDDAR